MIKDKSSLAIIPARGGSKRLPNKNILDLAGKPLITWSIESGLKSKYINKVVVSSDSDEILNISKKYGADIIKRPNELASDMASSFDSIKHAIENIKETFEYLILLQPTSPLRNNWHVDEAFELLYEKKADAIISVSEMVHSPLWSNTLPKDGSMANFLKDEVLDKRSQDLEQYYCLNGAIYICKIDRFLQEKSFFLNSNIFAYKMDRESSVDIDEKFDLQLAEMLIDNIHFMKDEIATDLLESYTRQGFGRLLKSEIDLIMFDFALKLIFRESKPEYFINEGTLNYFAINKQDIYELSKILKITENKLSNNLEQLGLLKGILDDKIGLNSFVSLLKMQNQSDNDLHNGKIACYISNKLLKNFILTKIVSLGGKPDFSHNKDIIYFDLFLLTNFFGKSTNTLKAWIETQNELKNDKDINRIKKELEKEKLDSRKIAISISKTILGKFTGAASDQIVDNLLDFLWKKY